MANPLSQNSLLSFNGKDGLISEQQDNVADTAAATQLAAPAGGTGATEGAYDSAANRNLAIVSINAARADIAALRTTVLAILAVLEAHGLMKDA